MDPFKRARRAFFVFLPLASALAVQSASAQIVNPAPGSTVHGDVTITENRGGVNTGPCTGASSQLIVSGPFGTVINQFFPSPGPWSYTWVTHNFPRGTYTLQTIANDRSFIGFGCSTNSGILSSFSVNLDNISAMTSSAPPTVAFGDPTFVSGTLRDQFSGRAITGRPITISLGSTTTTVFTSPIGSFSASLPGTASAGPGQILVSFAGDSSWRPSSQTLPITILKRATRVTYTGATDGLQGTSTTLSAVLTDFATGQPISGDTLRFTMGSFAASAPTDANGRASVSFVLDDRPGALPLLASYEETATRAASEATGTFTLRWEYTFTDQGGAGSVFLNPSTKQLLLDVPAQLLPIKRDEGMILVETAPAKTASVAFNDADLTIVGTFELRTGTFGSVASAGLQPYVLGRVA